VLYNNGSGQFSEPEYYDVDYHPGGIACGDLNNDGRDDIVVCGLKLEIYLSNPNSFQYILVDDLFYMCSVKIADIDNDGYNDIIAVDSHIWRGILHLRYYDILELNLFDTIQMDNVYYKINRIEFNPLTEMADVELVKTTSFATKSNSLKVKTGAINPPRNPDSPVEPGRPWVGGWGLANPWMGGGFPWYAQLPLGVGNGWNNWRHHTSAGTLYYAGGTKTYKKRGAFTNNSFGSGIKTKNVHNNYYDKSKFIDIKGKNNFVSSNCSSVSILGDTNNVANQVKRVSIVGNNNTIDAGVTNTNVVGDNLYVTESNASYIGGTIIKNGSVQVDLNKINGGICEVQDPFNSSVNGNLIKCGKDAVQNIGGMSKINFIIGGIDRVGPNIFRR
jgi:hypothetical protein